MAEQFTPGPWEARVSDGQWVVVRDRGDVLVASCGLAGEGYVTPRADALLIAAAPALRAALEALVDPSASHIDLHTRQQNARAALRAVRGEQR